MKAGTEPEGDTKERILQAAELVFADKGASGARTREIAAAAGVNVAQLHYHFGSKEGLYQAVLQNAAARVRRVVSHAVDEGGEPHERIARGVRAHFDLLASRPHVVRLILDALLRRDETARAFVHETLGPIVARVAPALFEGLAQGVLRPVDQVQALLSAFGMNAIYFIARPAIEELLGPEAYAPEGLRHRREAVIDLLLHGVRVREGEGSGEAEVHVREPSASKETQS